MSRCPVPGCLSPIGAGLCVGHYLDLPLARRARLDYATGSEERTAALAEACAWLSRGHGPAPEGEAGAGAEAEPTAAPRLCTYCFSDCSPAPCTWRVVAGAEGQS